MSEAVVDLTRADNVMREMFSDDKSAKDEFAEHVSKDLVPLAESLAKCFAAFSVLSEAAVKTGTTQAALVAALAYGVVDDVLTSTKLLLTGKLMPSGNVMRQAVEGVAMAVLCAAPDLVVIDRKKDKPVVARYWERLVDDDKRTGGHRAIEQLSWNQATLGVSADAVNRLKRAKTHYNNHSHAGLFGFASRAALGKEGQVYAGGHFDIEKLKGYQVEVRERIGLCGILPELFRVLAARVGE